MDLNQKFNGSALNVEYNEEDNTFRFSINDEYLNSNSFSVNDKAIDAVKQVLGNEVQFNNMNTSFWLNVKFIEY